MLAFNNIRYRCKYLFNFALITYIVIGFYCLCIIYISYDNFKYRYASKKYTFFVGGDTVEL